MNKSELIAKIADDTGLAKAKATEVVDLIGKVITEALNHGDGPIQSLALAHSKSPNVRQRKGVTLLQAKPSKYPAKKAPICQGR